MYKLSWVLLYKTLYSYQMRQRLYKTLYSYQMRQRLHKILHIMHESRVGYYKLLHESAI